MPISLSARTALFVLASVFAAWWFWPTETRAVAAAIDRLEEFAEAADWDGFMTGVSRGYNHEGTTYADLRDMGQALGAMIGPCDIYVLRKLIKVTGALASAHVALMVSASGPDARFRGTGRMVWQISFRKEGGKWLLFKAMPVELPYLSGQASTIRDIRDHLGL